VSSRPTADDRYLTARQVGELLGLSVKTVLTRFEHGDLPGFRLYGRVGAPVRFREAEIEAVIAEWEAAAPGRGVSQHTTPGAARGTLRATIPFANTPGRRTRPTNEEDR
jgi:predicted DNA-binding transcriptional regulator AlpA